MWKLKLENLDNKAVQKLSNYVLEPFVPRIASQATNTGKRYSRPLHIVENLKGEGDFKEVAQTIPENPVNERPITPTVIGLQSTFDKVWRCLTEEQAGIIGIYGMGGVGKTTLLTKISNQFLDFPNNCDVVIWVVVSKDLKLEKIQESIAKEIGLFNESWKIKSLEDRAQEIFKILSQKEFVLLLDDIWERAYLITVGLPPPTPENVSKVVFSTREVEACGGMEAQKSFKVERLRYEDAWR
ncbi:NBS-LRR type disease resistance protein [Melia azedarach]|uniref:NBS-LRR type disease resistance protein n=1 Tax=Melia azedarach TaxID=155640 RepID=A0ACC1YCS3_MELAZ|nr:NBS-LRR type disease resistance protein [Melia azedarach]